MDIRSSLPGIFSALVLVVYVVASILGGDPVSTTNVGIVVLGAIATILGIQWMPPKLPAQGDGFAANLPGIFSFAVLVVFVVTQLVGGDPWAAADFATAVLASIAAWLGLEWLPPRLPAQDTRKA